ncbi:glycosyltransferase family 2 protein [Catalinimonas niigatensis]|uniref:glycosyltransferase family 2 protein n=1 Tax=Catalinimonas niigatensis TaxID=1397264 RepID=UPI0026667B59|nr:glycosyltransferase family 2 protein [Catalinimonas niigatensis]WPP53321.1 glycosyltransferase family 2 protein [Catalinimonas niigatensis]
MIMEGQHISNSKVSIIIPVYNRVDLIEECIQSIKKQTYANFEVIVVDDGSTDGSYEYIQKVSQQDNRIKALRRDRLPKGAPTCRNMGISKAEGEYIIFLDSDDLLAPFCLEQRLSYFQQHSEYDFLVFSMLLFKEKAGDMNLLWNIDRKEDDLLRFLRSDSVWSITGPIHKKKSIEAIGGFDESLPFWQDLDLHVRMLIRGANYKKMMHLPPDCFNRRHNFDSISHKGSSQLNKLKTKEKIFKKIVNELRTHKVMKKEYDHQVVAMFFGFSYEWIKSHRHICNALELWNDVFKEKLVGSRNFTLGYICLVLKDIALSTNSKFLHLLHQAIKLMLPRLYWKKETFLSKVRYKAEIKTNP